MIAERDIQKNFLRVTAAGLALVAGITSDIRNKGLEQACFDMSANYIAQDGTSFTHTTRGRCYELGAVPRVIECDPVVRQSVIVLGFKVQNIGAKAFRDENKACNAVRVPRIR